MKNHIEERAQRSHSRSRSDDGNAFLPDTDGSGSTKMKPRLVDDAESFAQEFVASATSADPVGEYAGDEVADDEEGGPFIVLDANAQLPPEKDDADEDDELPVSQQQVDRAAKWAARGL